MPRSCERAHEWGKRAKRTSRARGGVMLGATIALSLVACSKKQSGQGPTFDTGPSVSTVVRASWGSGEGQLGRDVPEVGLPEGPASFVVDQSSTIHVLDRQNGRIQKFAEGKSAGVVALPARPFEDIDLLGSSYALLDLHSVPALVLLDESGVVKSEVSLEGPEIAEPSLITALVDGGDGFYVEIEDEYLVRVTDASGAVVEQSVVPGQAIDGSVALKVESVDEKRLALYRIGLPDGEPAPMGEIGFAERVAERTLFSPAVGGGVLIAVRLELEQGDPEAPPASTSSLVVIEPGGGEKRRLDLPQSDGVEDVFRSVKRGRDGFVYVLRTSDAGVEIAKVKP